MVGGLLMQEFPYVFSPGRCQMLCLCNLFRHISNHIPMKEIVFSIAKFPQPTYIDWDLFYIHCLFPNNMINVVKKIIHSKAPKDWLAFS